MGAEGDVRGKLGGAQGIGTSIRTMVQPFPCIRITLQAPPCDCSSGGLQSRSGFQDFAQFSDGRARYSHLLFRCGRCGHTYSAVGVVFIPFS